MAYGKPEKICIDRIGGKYKKFLKRSANKRRRILEKRDPSNAPKKNAYYGWST